MSILDELAAHAMERVAAAKLKIDPEAMGRMAYEAAGISTGSDEEQTATHSDSDGAVKPSGSDLRFMRALRSESKDGKKELSFICECKKASPSKGVIARSFPYLDIAKQYEAAGADAISVLTEPKWFMGKDEYLREIASTVKTPCLRKDFTVDAYMIYEAKVLGAAAVLLIVSILTPPQIRDYLSICDKLGLDALVEAHDETEVDIALQAGAKIIGVNNRNLKDFTIDTSNSARLRSMIPDDVIYVSESGVSSAEDVKKIREIGADAVLIGEALMRADDKKAMLDSFRQA